MSKVTSIIEELVTPITTELNLELVDVEFVKEGRELRHRSCACADTFSRFGWRPGDREEPPAVLGCAVVCQPDAPRV